MPEEIANPIQRTLDHCMQHAKDATIAVIAPFLTPATMAGLSDAIPTVIGAATGCFVTCVGHEPQWIPYTNQIAITIKTVEDA
ncbi:hypothetical protein COI44_01915 [Bacillus sp. AFS088145]|nr:hypothetical protein COI44_01915 [Bacillus sp. AFS088145]